jgi:thymidylate synthase
MQSYINLVKDILKYGKVKEDRTGVGTVGLFGVQLKHDMSKGFPLLTSKKMYTRAILVELEGFLNGITDKKWYQDRKCKIWNEWCNPEKVPYGHDEITKEKMKAERDLGPVYGYQWRYFGAEYKNYDTDYTNQGTDQIKNIIETLKKNPNSRRMIVSAHNPNALHQMALDPCHYSWEVNVLDGKLNLKWNQRSVDTMLGLPFNIASYGVLLHLLAKEANLKPGVLTAHLGDTHIYKNHIQSAKEQVKRNPLNLPKIEIKDFNSILNWKHDQVEFINYEHHPKIAFPIAV